MPPGVVDIPRRKIIQNPVPIRFLSESMPDGKSREGAAPSSRSMRAMALTAAARRARRAAVAWVFAIAPMLRTLAQMSARRPSGTFVAWASWRTTVRKMRQVSAAATTVIGVIAQNAIRHRPSPASTPPSAGPPSAAMPQAREIVASM